MSSTTDSVVLDYDPKVIKIKAYSRTYVGKLWCFCRMMYLPMAYIYGKKFVGPITQTILDLRKEIYYEAYDNIDWNKARNTCCKVYPFYLLNNYKDAFSSYIL